MLKNYAMRVLYHVNCYFIHVNCMETPKGLYALTVAQVGGGVVPAVGAYAFVGVSR